MTNTTVVNNMNQSRSYKPYLIVGICFGILMGIIIGMVVGHFIFPNAVIFMPENANYTFDIGKNMMMAMNLTR
jgi:hypothetical protein